MKIWFISDTHGRHQDLAAPPPVDMVVHCGDEANSRSNAINANESHEFFRWYEGLPIEYKVFVPGDHSKAIECGMVRPEEYPSVKFLLHEAATIAGWKFFGSPYSPVYGQSWAYMKKRNKLDAVWQSIPKDTEILITHGPPKGILDKTHDKDSGNKIVQVGCAALRNHTERIVPIIHAFGHIHDEKGLTNSGRYTHQHIEFINCSCLINGSNLINNGFVVEI